MGYHRQSESESPWRRHWQVPVERLVEVPVEVVREMLVHVPVEVVREQVVEVPVEWIVELVVRREVFVDRFVEKPPVQVPPARPLRSTNTMVL